MRIGGTVARLLLGLMFTVFGLNGFFHFIHQPPPSSETAMQYMGAMAHGGMFPFIFGLQLVGGLLMLAGVFVPIALVLLGPVIVNILLFHALMAPSEIGPGLLALVLWLVVFYGTRDSFAGIFRMRAPELRS